MKNLCCICGQCELIDNVCKECGRNPDPAPRREISRLAIVVETYGCIQLAAGIAALRLVYNDEDGKGTLLQGSDIAATIHAETPDGPYWIENLTGPRAGQFARALVPITNTYY